ncbi:MAG: hypothetical protein EXR99_09640 [Gemmataceae bacterium]|nr:hypothetical protein [Gemmataceae bacterium]
MVAKAFFRFKGRVQAAWIATCYVAFAWGLAGCQNSGGNSSALDKYFGPLPSANGANNGASVNNGAGGFSPVSPTPIAFGNPAVSDKDPLFGGVPVSRIPSPTANAAIPGTFNSGQGGLPNLPSPSSATSPAALATGSFSTLDPSRNNVMPVGVNPAPAVSPFGTPEEFRSLMQQITTRGLAWQRLDYNPQAGEWKFYCAIKDPSQPGVTRNFETTARTDVSALRAVLNEIDRTFPPKK